MQKRNILILEAQKSGQDQGYCLCIAYTCKIFLCVLYLSNIFKHFIMCNRDFMEIYYFSFHIFYLYLFKDTHKLQISTMGISNFSYSGPLFSEFCCKRDYSVFLCILTNLLCSCDLFITLFLDRSPKVNNFSPLPHVGSVLFEPESINRRIISVNMNWKSEFLFQEF